MASKETWFHPTDPDWTRGRAQAVADAESIARRQIGRLVIHMRAPWLEGPARQMHPEVFK